MEHRFLWYVLLKIGIGTLHHTVNFFFNVHEYPCSNSFWLFASNTSRRAWGGLWNVLGEFSLLIITRDRVIDPVYEGSVFFNLGHFISIVIILIKPSPRWITLFVYQKIRNKNSVKVNICVNFIYAKQAVFIILTKHDANQM